MKKFAAVLVLFSAMIAFAGREGEIQNNLPPEQSLASMADWYTVKAINISGLTDITMLTTYPLYILKMFSNQSSTTNGKVKVITVQGDTVTVSVMAGQSTGKLPPIKFVFKTGTSDSLIWYFQKR